MRTTAVWTAALPRAYIGEMRSLSDPATLVVDFFENYSLNHSGGGFGMASMGGLQTDAAGVRFSVLPVTADFRGVFLPNQAVSK